MSPIDRYRVRGTVERLVYLTQCVSQAEAWVQGRSEHIAISNECVPDFSCCVKTSKDTPLKDKIDHLNKMKQLLKDERTNCYKKW